MFGIIILHVDVRQYPVEWRGLWLLARFKEINEVNDYDFNQNNTWFNSKLTTSSNYN